MMIANTPRWALPLLFAGQAQKEIFHNEALVLIDAILHGRVESASVATPPSEPEQGRCWIVASGPTGAWAGQEGTVACWSDGGWRFIAPRAGMTMQVADLGHRLHHDGSHWAAGVIRSDGLYIGTDKIAGVRQEAIAAPAGGATVDQEARSSISAILNAMRQHGLIAT